MKTVLMVAEKPSLAQSIAKILSRGNVSSHKGLNGTCSVHEYTGTFAGQPVRFKMTSVCGHVMTLDFLGKYNKWDKVDPAELFSQAPTEKKEANPKLNMVKFLQVEGKGCDYIVLWLDCDKEGENICFENRSHLFPVKKLHARLQHDSPPTARPSYLFEVPPSPPRTPSSRRRGNGHVGRSGNSRSLCPWQ